MMIEIRSRGCEVSSSLQQLFHRELLSVCAEFISWMPRVRLLLSRSEGRHPQLTASLQANVFGFGAVRGVATGEDELTVFRQALAILDDALRDLSNDHGVGSIVETKSRAVAS